LIPVPDDMIPVPDDISTYHQVLTGYDPNSASNHLGQTTGR